MLEEQQGKNYQLADQLALKEDQIAQLQRALELRKAEMQGQLLLGNTLHVVVHARQPDYINISVICQVKLGHVSSASRQYTSVVVPVTDALLLDILHVLCCVQQHCSHAHITQWAHLMTACKATDTAV